MPEPQMPRHMIIPPQELEIIQPDPRVYDLLEQMLKLHGQMLATFMPAMIYRTPDAAKPQSQEPPCRS